MHEGIKLYLILYEEHWYVIAQNIEIEFLLRRATHAKDGDQSMTGSKSFLRVLEKNARVEHYSSTLLITDIFTRTKR